MLRQDEQIHGVIDRQVTRDQWPAEANEFTIEIDLREQLLPGELTITAACHDVCCGWVEGPPEPTTERPPSG